MTMYTDHGHKPNSKWGGDDPKTEILHGPHDIRVTLDTWGPSENLMAHLWNAFNSTFGDEPEMVMRDEDLTDGMIKFVEDKLKGKSPYHVLEGIKFWFTVDNVTRATTHQIVRTRDAAFLQHGGRDNDWRMRPWRMPETVRRAVTTPVHDVIVHDEWPFDLGRIDEWANEQYPGLTGEEALMAHIKINKELYAALVDSGVPYQDARYVLPIGTTTYLRGIYDYPTLVKFLSDRLEFAMGWEINCVAQLMVRELHFKVPGILSSQFMSHSDRAHMAAFAHLNLFPPDGKWPVPAGTEETGYIFQEVQNPYFVLHPSSFLNPNVLEWVGTDGKYPVEIPALR